MPLNITFSATYLIVADNLPTRSKGELVEHLKIVVGGTWSAMQKQQRRLVGLLAHYAIVSLKTSKGHLARNYFQWAMACRGVVV